MASETTPTTGSPSESDPKPTAEPENAPETAEIDENPVETAPKAPKTPRKGVYTLQRGDSPSTVSVKHYGRANKAVELVRANPDSLWEPGETISLV